MTRKNEPAPDRGHFKVRETTMIEPTHPDREPFDLDAPSRLIEDLRGLEGVDLEVPPAVDAAILEEARERLSPPVVHLPGAGGSRRGSRRAAAAAVAVLGVAVWIGWPQPDPVAVIADPSDVDGSGSVDILDAFAVARWLDEERAIREARLDFNADGVIDRRDVDALAAAVVRVDLSGRADR